MQCNGVKEKIRDQLRADGFFSFFLCVFFVFGLFFFLFFVFFFGATVSGDGRLRWFVRVFTRPGRRIGLRRIGLLAAAGVGLSPEADPFFFLKGTGPCSFSVAKNWRSSFAERRGHVDVTLADPNRVEKPDLDPFDP